MTRLLSGRTNKSIYTMPTFSITNNINKPLQNKQL